MKEDKRRKRGDRKIKNFKGSKGITFERKKF
jgi:hypothetical protein